MALRIKSLAVAAPSIEQLCTKFAARLKEAKPDALLFWLTDRNKRRETRGKVASRPAHRSARARMRGALACFQTLRCVGQDERQK